MAKQYADLRKMNIPELIKNHDKHASGVATPPNYWLSEIERRERENHDRITKKLTIWITIMTGVMTLTIIVNFIIFLNK